MLKAGKKKYNLLPGTLLKCESGRYIAFYEHRTDIIANGENATDAKKNLKKMYKIVSDFEEKEAETNTVKLPPHTQRKTFQEKFAIH